MADITIDGLSGDLSTSPLPASEAIVLYADLMRIVGKASDRLPAIIMGYAADDANSNFAAEMHSVQGIVEILSVTPSKEVVELIGRLVETVQIMQPSGAKRTLDLDGDFTGNLTAIAPVLRFVLEVQFRDFFIASLGSGIRRVIQEISRQPKPEESPQT